MLSGIFSDDEGDYPAGSYLRNPPGSSHRPHSRDGAVIFVKLRQMAPAETRQLRIDTREPAAWQALAGREVCPLYTSACERVSLLCMDAAQAPLPCASGGAELLVLAGALADGERAYPQGSWLRLPPGRYPELLTGEQGARLYLKTGHLAQATTED